MEYKFITLSRDTHTIISGGAYCRYNVINYVNHFDTKLILLLIGIQILM